MNNLIKVQKLMIVISVEKCILKLWTIVIKYEDYIEGFAIPVS